MLDKIGLQLYSVREYSRKDFFKTLETVAKMGYKNVEHANYWGKTAKDIKVFADSIGITSVSSHVGLDVLKNRPDAEIEFALELGAKHLICPYAKFGNKEEYLRFCEFLNNIGKKCKENGLVFGYHNHAHEFETAHGQAYIDIIMENTSPEYVVAQFDVFWIKYAGIDPCIYLKKYAGRIPIIHLKEISDDGQNTVIGEGILDFKEIIKTATAGGCENFVIEQEASGGNEMEIARISLSNLASL